MLSERELDHERPYPSSAPYAIHRAHSVGYHGRERRRRPAFRSRWGTTGHGANIRYRGHDYRREHAPTAHHRLPAYRRVDSPTRTLASAYTA